MAFCDNCGHELRSTAKFCGSCGTKKEATDEYQQVTERALHSGDILLPANAKHRRSLERKNLVSSKIRRKPKKQELEEYEKEYMSRLESGSESRSKQVAENNARHSRNMERPGGWKSESTTLLLAIILGLFGLSGIGHLYVGGMLKGVVILIAGFMLGVVGVFLTVYLPYVFGILGFMFFIAYIPLYIWQIIDARKLCRYYNDYYEEYGEEPNW